MLIRIFPGSKCNLVGNAVSRLIWSDQRFIALKSHGTHHAKRWFFCTVGNTEHPDQLVQSIFSDQGLSWRFDHDILSGVLLSLPLI